MKNWLVLARARQWSGNLTASELGSASKERTQRIAHLVSMVLHLTAFAAVPVKTDMHMHQGKYRLPTIRSNHKYSTRKPPVMP